MVPVVVAYNLLEPPQVHNRFSLLLILCATNRIRDSPGFPPCTLVRPAANAIQSALDMLTLAPLGQTPSCSALIGSHDHSLNVMGIMACSSDCTQGCIGRRGGNPPPPPPWHTAYAQPLSP